MCVSRLAGVSVGPYSLFAGGMYGKQDSDAVDIFMNGQRIRTDRLSEPRGLIAATAGATNSFLAHAATAGFFLMALWHCAVGQLAFFAGGQNHAGNKSDVVDIFDSVTHKWSVAKLSVGRSMLAASAAGPFAIFAGTIAVCIIRHTFSCSECHLAWCSGIKPHRDSQQSPVRATEQQR